MAGVFTSLSASSNLSVSGNTTMTGSLTGSTGNFTSVSANTGTFNTLNIASYNNVLINTNNLQSITPSDNVNLYTNNTGIINLGNNSSVNPININNNIISNKKMTIEDVKINDLLECSRINSNNPSDIVILFSNTDGPINLGNTLSVNPINVNNNIVSNKKITTGLLESNSIEASVNSNDINLFRSSTGKNNIGNQFNTNDIKVFQPISVGTVKLFEDNISISTVNGNAMILDVDDVLNIKGSGSTFCNFYNDRIEMSNSTQSINSNIFRAKDAGSQVKLFDNQSSTIVIGNSSNSSDIVFNQDISLNNATNNIKSNIYQSFDTNAQVKILENHNNTAIIGNSSNNNPITFIQNIQQTNPTQYLRVQNIQPIDHNTEVKFFTNVVNSKITMGSNVNINAFDFQQLLSIPRMPIMAYTSMPIYQPNEIGQSLIFDRRIPNVSGPGSYVSGSLVLPIGVWAINYSSSLTPSTGVASTLTQFATFLSVNSASPFYDGQYPVVQQIPFNIVLNSSVNPIFLNGSYILTNTVSQTFQIGCNIQYTGTQTGLLNIIGTATRIA